MSVFADPRFIAWKTICEAKGFHIVAVETTEVKIQYRNSMSALFVLNSMMQKIIAQKHVKRVHYINEMSAIFEPNSLNLKSKSMLKITLHKWHKCYICNKFFKPKILA